MMEERNLICISCPIGCRLTLVKDDSSPQGYSVVGNACKRGIDYAIKEVTAPTRMVTSTAKIRGAALSRIPVRTSVAVPKERIRECMAIIDALDLESPIVMGQVLVDNLFGTGAQIIASRSL